MPIQNLSEQDATHQRSNQTLQTEIYQFGYVTLHFGRFILQGICKLTRKVYYPTRLCVHDKYILFIKT